MTNFNLQYRERTKKFTLRVIRLFQCLPKNEAAKIIGKQLLRSGTAVGANFRGACRGRVHNYIFRYFTISLFKL